MHNDFLRVNGGKMSKSLGNFYKLQDIIDKGWLKEAFIDNDIFGSDHCPVGLVLEI